jgi:hypothetical protein
MARGLRSAASDPHSAARFISKELRETRRGPASIECITRFRIELAHELDKGSDIRLSSPLDRRSHAV